MHTIHNARIALLANLLNTMAGSSFTVGVAAPIAALVFYNPSNVRLAPAFLGIIIWGNSSCYFTSPHKSCSEGFGMTNFDWVYLVIGPIATLVIGGILFWSRRFTP